MQHWKTNITGALTILCGTSQFVGLIPADYVQYAMLACNVLIGLGLISAADAKKPPSA